MKGPHVVVVVSQRDGRRERDIRFIIARTRKGDAGISERAYLYRLGESIVKWRRERERDTPGLAKLVAVPHTAYIQHPNLPKRLLIAIFFFFVVGGGNNNNNNNIPVSHAKRLINTTGKPFSNKFPLSSSCLSLNFHRRQITTWAYPLLIICFVKKKRKEKKESWLHSISP